MCTYLQRLGLQNKVNIVTVVNLEFNFHANQITLRYVIGRLKMVELVEPDDGRLG